jgi:hypothetical protein
MSKISRGKKEILEKVISILEKKNIRYAIAGPFANYVWGIDRNVNDLYIVVEGYEYRSLKKEFSESRIRFRKLQHNDINNYIKLFIAECYVDDELESVVLMEKSANMPPEVIERAVGIEFIRGRIYYVVSPEDCILFKLINKTPPDIKDAQKIYYKMKGRLDLNYLKKMCKNYRINFKKIFAEVNNKKVEKIREN